MTCPHTAGRWVPQEDDYWTGEPTPAEWVEHYTYEDFGVGRFRCTQCKEIGYYTGHWKNYYEKGIPCFGSDGVPRGGE